MSDYSIVFDLPEMWKRENSLTVNLAAAVIGARLSTFTGLDAQESFSQVFGEQHFRYNNALDNPAHSTGNAVIFRRGMVTLPLVIHELGHTFDRRCGLKPQTALVAGGMDVIHKDGFRWAGMHPLKSEDGERPAERWANLFADWALQMLAPNLDGIALREWVDDHMPGWIEASMQEGKSKR